MCGIAGEIAFGGRQPDRDALSRVLAGLRHRGPDGDGIHIEGSVALGHRRLTIIDLTDNSAQPMVDVEAGCAITYNGEIYNYLELRERLEAKGHRFRTQGDTEVLLRAYLEWGELVVEHLHGMFSFAIHDQRNQKVFAARDAAGQKPFLYFHHAAGLIFASELDALLRHSAVPRAIDRNAVCHFLVYESFVDGRTIIEGVRRLPPGSALTVNLRSGEIRVRQYWRPVISTETANSRDPSGADFASVETVLRRAVQEHLRSDVPVGVYLSGGIDSNLIATLACDVRPAREIRTFTVRHTDPSFDEADEARWTADRLGTHHHETTLTNEQVLESVPKILDTLDEPLADPGLVSIYQVARFAAQHVKVVLSGDGGDEFFYGYAPFHKWQLAERFAVLPDWSTRAFLKRAIDRLPAQYGYMGAFYKAQVFSRGFGLPAMIRNMAWLEAFSANELSRLMQHSGGLNALMPSNDGIAAVYDPVRAVYEANPGLNGLQHLALEYQSIYLPGNICAHSDKANMMHSLEARSPLLDRSVMEMANALPLHWKLRGGEGKWILRHYLDRRLGPSVARRKKRGFTVPLANWLRGPLKPMAERLLSPDAINAGGLFNPEEVQRLWREHQDGRRNHYKKLWSLVVLQSWQQRVVGL